MSDVPCWLIERVAGAPDDLRTRMTDAVAHTSPHAALHDRLAAAAEACLARGMRDQSRDSALELLAADALFTHACEAAAAIGSDALNAFAASWDAARFEQLLPKSS